MMNSGYNGGEQSAQEVRYVKGEIFLCLLSEG
jgi:hypothetical protein